MARSFAVGSDQYLRCNSAVVTAAPLTVSLWFKKSGNGESEYNSLFYIGDESDKDCFWMQAYDHASWRDLFTYKYQNDYKYASTPVGSVSDDTWYHAFSRWRATGTVRMDGCIDDGTEGTSANTTTPAGANLDITLIGGRIRDSGSLDRNIDGQIAHVAVWNTDLSDEDRTSLYSGGVGCDPRTIRPDALVSYWPLEGDDLDHWGPNDMTPYNTPTWDDSFTISRSGGIWVPYQVAATSGTDIDCTLGTVVVSGLQATVEAGATVACTLGTVVIAGLQAEIEQGTTVACTLGTITVTGLQADIEQGTTVGCSVGVVTIAGLQAAVEQGTTVACTLGTITVTGLAAEIEQGTTVACSLGTVAVTGLQATVSNAPSIDCSLGTVVVSGLQASISAATTVSCSLGTVVVSGLSATVGAGSTVDCTLGTVVVTGLAAEVEQGTTVDCTTGAVVVSGLAATIGAATTVDCTAGTILVASLSASVTNVSGVVARRTFEATSTRTFTATDYSRTFDA